MTDRLLSQALLIACNESKGVFTRAVAPASCNSCLVQKLQSTPNSFDLIFVSANHIIGGITNYEGLFWVTIFPSQTGFNDTLFGKTSIKRSVNTCKVIS